MEIQRISNTPQNLPKREPSTLENVIASILVAAGIGIGLTSNSQMRQTSPFYRGKENERPSTIPLLAEPRLRYQDAFTLRKSWTTMFPTPKESERPSTIPLLAEPTLRYQDAFTLRKSWTTMFPTPKESERPSAIPLLTPSLLLPATSATTGIDMYPKPEYPTTDEAVRHGIQHLLNRDVSKSIYATKKTARAWIQAFQPYLNHENCSPETQSFVKRTLRILDKKNKDAYASETNFRRALAASQRYDESEGNWVQSILKPEVIAAVYQSKQCANQWRRILKPEHMKETSPNTFKMAQKAYWIFGRRNRGLYSTQQQFQKALTLSFRNIIRK